MAHFLIYLPGAKGAAPELLERAGLGDLTARAEFLASRGPDDADGCLVAWRKPGGDSRFCFDPQAQTWAPAVPAGELPTGRYWVGFWNDGPPRPADLARDYPYRGHSLPLGDGQHWLFPEARELPRDLILADDGSVRFEVQRRFHAFWLESLEWVSRLNGGDEVQVSYSAVFSFLSRALALNYRLVPELVSALRLFSTENIRDPLLAVVGVLGELKRLQTAGAGG